MQQDDDKNPFSFRDAFDWSQCSPYSGWKDNDKGTSAIKCPWGSFYVPARSNGDGSYDPRFHTKGRAFGGPGSHPNKTVDPEQLTQPPIPVPQEELPVLEKYEQEMGPKHEEERLKFCKNQRMQLLKYRNSKLKKKPPYLQKSEDDFSNVCEWDESLDFLKRFGETERKTED